MPSLLLSSLDSRTFSFPLLLLTYRFVYFRLYWFWYTWWVGLLEFFWLSGCLAPVQLCEYVSSTLKVRSTSILVSYHSFRPLGLVGELASSMARSQLLRATTNWFFSLLSSLLNGRILF